MYTLQDILSTQKFLKDKKFVDFTVSLLSEILILEKKQWLKVTGNALNIEYYFWWRDYCFGLLIHDYAPFYFVVSISDEYKYKRLVKTTFKLCGKLIFLELYHTRN